MLARIWALSLTFLLTMMSGCSTIGAESRHTESSAASSRLSARLEKDVEYSRVNGISLRMDVSIPGGAERSPAVIIVHGGGWVAGDRQYNVQPLFRPLTDGGFAWFSISYRLAADVSQFGAAISDVQEAIRFVKFHAADYHIDADNV